MRNSRRVAHMKELQTQVSSLNANFNKVYRQFIREFSSTLTETALVSEQSLDALEIDSRYLRLGPELGKGAFGVVRQATYALPKTKKVDVAVKLVHSSIDSMAANKFLVETYLLCSLRHPNLIKVIGIQTKTRPTLLLMEMMLNGNLRSYLHRCSNNEHANDTVIRQSETLHTSLTARALTQICRQIADVMVYLSTNRIIHRDLASRFVFFFNTQWVW